MLYQRQTRWYGSTNSALGMTVMGYCRSLECVPHIAHYTDQSPRSTVGICFLSGNMSEHVSRNITPWHCTIPRRATTSTCVYLSHWCVINRSIISCHKISFSSLILNVTVGTPREFRVYSEVSILNHIKTVSQMWLSCQYKWTAIESLKSCNKLGILLESHKCKDKPVIFAECC